MRLSKSFLFFSGLAIAVTEAGCQRREQIDERIPFLLSNESEWASSTFPALPLGAAELRELTTRALDRSGRFVAGNENGAGRAAPTRVFVEVLSAEITHQASDQVLADVRIRMQLQPSGEAQEGNVVVASGSGRGSELEASRVAVMAALGHALDQVATEQHGPSQTAAELIADLGSTDPARVDLALGRLAARRDPACLPPLLARLAGADADAAQQALAYLVSLNDPRAVHPIIEQAEERSLAFRIEALYALGSLGGDEAQAYLFTLMSDPDARVRAVASEALGLAKRRSVGRPVVRPPEPVR